jgi:hypothetical protein
MGTPSRGSCCSSSPRSCWDPVETVVAPRAVVDFVVGLLVAAAVPIGEFVDDLFAG